MRIKKILIAVLIILLLLSSGLLAYRYAAMPRLPDEMPTKITATYHCCMEDETYIFTDEEEIEQIISEIKKADISVHRKIKQELYCGGSSYSATFEYENKALDFNWASGPQFYDVKENGVRILYEIDSENALHSVFDKHCERNAPLCKGRWHGE